jgi:uncharacterized protein YecT (DUF1311 family)
MPTAKDVDAPSGAGFSFTATHATIIVALLGAIGTGAGAIFTARENLRLEEARRVAAAELEQAKHNAAADLARMEFEIKLIFRAIEGSDSTERIRNLQFFLDAGFLRDPEGRIRNLDPSKFPSKVNPSFDCLIDTDPAARMICANPALAALDTELAKAYDPLKKKLAGTDEQQKLIVAQREWLRQRDTCVSDAAPVSCMQDKYWQRIRELLAQTAGPVAASRTDEGREKAPSPPIQ